MAHRVVELLNAAPQSPRLGRFAVHGSAEEWPALQIPGLPITMPSTASTIPVQFPFSNDGLAALGAVLQAAPFGLGAQTLVDDKVRKTLQIDPALVRFENPKFETQLQALAARAASLLGYYGATMDAEDSPLGMHMVSSVHAKLHKLLIYRPGDFFVDHRDATHQPGMFGTLLLQLPCCYKGGRLIVQHEGEAEVIDHSDPATSPFSSHFSAFYADCVHRVEEVTDCALCLRLTWLGRPLSPIIAMLSLQNLQMLLRRQPPVMLTVSLQPQALPMPPPPWPRS